mgnify:CR=1 FL=1
MGISSDSSSQPSQKSTTRCAGVCPNQAGRRLQRSDTKQLFLSLRSPLPIISNVDSITKQEIQISAYEIRKPELFIPEQDKSIKTFGYVLGISFTVAGIIQENSKTSVNWELPAGIMIFLGTYVYDKYFDKQKNNSIEHLEEDK